MTSTQSLLHVCFLTVLLCVFELCSCGSISNRRAYVEEIASAEVPVGPPLELVEGVYSSSPDVKVVAVFPERMPPKTEYYQRESVSVVVGVANQGHRVASVQAIAGFLYPSSTSSSSLNSTSSSSPQQVPLIASHNLTSLLQSVQLRPRSQLSLLYQFELQEGVGPGPYQLSLSLFYQLSNSSEVQVVVPQANTDSDPSPSSSPSSSSSSSPSSTPSSASSPFYSQTFYSGPLVVLEREDPVTVSSLLSTGAILLVIFLPLCLLLDATPTKLKLAYHKLMSSSGPNEWLPASPLQNKQLRRSHRKH